MNLTAAELAKHLGADVLGDSTVMLHAFAPADQAAAGQVTFAENETFLAAAESSQAAAIITPKTFNSTKKVLIRADNPRVAFAKALALLHPEPTLPAGIHASAVVAASAQIDPTAHVGPFCVIGERVRVGAGVILLAGVNLGDDVTVGDGSKLFPHVTVYPRGQIGKRVRIHASATIGADGFGYVFDAGSHRKVPQIGNVILGDDVEIGANACVDRGALGSTVLGKGTKIDNLVQIAHNVQIGDHCAITAQVGIAGSAKLGSYVVIGGQTGIGGHLTIGNQVEIGAASAVMTDIPDKSRYLGTPAQPSRECMREIAALRKLPELLKKVSEWEKKLSGE